MMIQQVDDGFNKYFILNDLRIDFEKPTNVSHNLYSSICIYRTEDSSIVSDSNCE